MSDIIPTRSYRALVAAIVVLAAAAMAEAGSPEQQCQAGKNKIAGKYAACRENAEAKEVATGDDDKFHEAIAKCSLKFGIAWQKAESKAVGAGTTCPSVGDAAATEAKVTGATDAVAARASGIHFVDNGNGTITDTHTGLQWEKKNTTEGSGEDYGNPHDVDNYYKWSATPSGAADGPAFADFLSKLNTCTSSDGNAISAGFAGHCDWRLPTSGDLQTILDFSQGNCGGGSGACIDPIFGPSQPSQYWSSITGAGDVRFAWFVGFNDGTRGNGYKDLVGCYVRAVRGGD
jgi:hypothetical protein